MLEFLSLFIRDELLSWLSIHKNAVPSHNNPTPHAV